MNRNKLEYLIINFDIKEKKEMIWLIDPNGDYEFKKHISKFLLEPDTTDLNILNQLPVLKYYPDEKERFLKKFINLYEQINALCIKNNICPFFKDTSNVSECEKRRLDIVKLVPEESLNEFFNIDSFWNYKPSKYN